MTKTLVLEKQARVLTINEIINRYEISNQATLILSGIILSTCAISRSFRGIPLLPSKTNYFHPEQFNATSEPLRHFLHGYTWKAIHRRIGCRI